MWRKNLDLSQTIFALASGSLPSAIAIERLAGPQAFSIANQIFRTPDGKPLERKRGMLRGQLFDAESNKIDDILLLTFAAPHSYTGENLLEFHCHGSIAVIRKLEQLMTDFGARPAEKGEFSYRAHLNGKLDLQELDTLGDLFLARDTADLRGIHLRRDSSLEITIGLLREELIQLQAIFDTAIDFSDEYSEVIHEATLPLKKVTQRCYEITQRYSSFRAGGMVNRIVLAGRPNAGKSSLFNALLCRYRALVDAMPGTTRDVIEEDVEIAGRRWKIADTAGLRLGQGQAEQEGIALGEDFLASSSFWILIVDGIEGFSDQDRSLLQKYGRIPHQIVWNKSDRDDWQGPQPGFMGDESALPVSATTGRGIAELWECLINQISSICSNTTEPLPTATQAVRLERVQEALKKLGQEIQKGLPPEYLAEQSRSIFGLLDVVMGEVDQEMILDRVFRDYCIGK